MPVPHTATGRLTKSGRPALRTGPQKPPAWHARANALMAQGVSRSLIAERLGVTYQAVYLATNPEAKAKMRERDRLKYERKMATRDGPLLMRLAAREQAETRDFQRAYLRQQARELWGDGGCVEDLDAVYQRLGCA
jgi:hypothetical protein